MAAANLMEAAAAPLTFPDVPGYRTLLCDLHTHTVFSDGIVWPSVRVEEARREGLHAVAITDHLEYQPHSADIPHPDRNRAHLIAQRAASEDGVLVIRGAEITRDMPPGHVNAVFLHDANALLLDTPLAVLREARRQDAFVFWNHPAWCGQQPDGIARLNEMHRQLIDEGLVQGIEVVNGYTFSAEALQIALDNNLTILGNSDIHEPIEWQHRRFDGDHRPVTLAFVARRDEDGLREALRERRTAVFYNETLIGRADVIVPLIHACLDIAAEGYIDDTAILEVSIHNRASAPFILRAGGPIAFHDQAGPFTVPAHATRKLKLRTLQQTRNVTLDLQIVSALVAPDTHPIVTWELAVPDNTGIPPRDWSLPAMLDRLPAWLRR